MAAKSSNSTAVTIDRADLMPALALTRKAVARGNTIPILANMLVEVEKGRIAITATDLDLEIMAQAPCAGAKQAALTLPAQLFHDAVRKLPDGAEVSLEFDDRNGKIAAGRARFTMPLLPPSDFPRISAGELPVNFEIAAAELARIVETVSFAISSEETRFYLNGIHLHVHEEKLVAVATDGHRLAMLSLPLPDGAADLPPIIVPRRTVDMLKDFTTAKGKIAIAVSDSKIRFSVADDGGNPKFELVSKLIDGTFPDYRRVVPTGNANRFTVEREPLAKAIDRVITVASARGSGASFAFGAGAVKLSTSNPDSGSAEDEVPAEAGDGDDVEIGLNGRYCLDMLNAAAVDRLVFHIGSPGDPVRIEPEGGDTVTFVIMPMRV